MNPKRPKCDGVDIGCVFKKGVCIYCKQPAERPQYAHVKGLG
jgi:hypothetical protein